MVVNYFYVALIIVTVLAMISMLMHMRFNGGILQERANWFRATFIVIIFASLAEMFGVYLDCHPMAR